MDEEELQETIAYLPRTTFTEFLRSLDPLYIAIHADPTNPTYVPFGMYQTLNMGSIIDPWGVRELYSQLLGRLMVLVSALKASGRVLLAEEYIYLFRCAGAASDPNGAKWLWDEMPRTEAKGWRQTDIFTEFICARFLTRPLYTGYDKVRRMVLPRNLHRSRLTLNWFRVNQLDRLRFNLRRRKLFFGLNKTIEHAEDTMRMMRKKGAPTRLFNRIITDGIPVNEALLCACMIGFARVGSLRFINSKILRDYFGVQLDLPTYDDESADYEDVVENKQHLDPSYRVQPTIRLMQAAVETYCSNGEIATAFKVVDHLSQTYRIPIPINMWQDMLEWTYIMSSPPASTAWKYAGMPSKIPNSNTIELIWNAMISPPHNIQPGFDQYNILIRNLLGRNGFGNFLPYMRIAIEFYDDQVKEYQAATLEYVQMKRDGVQVQEILHRYEQAKLRKEKMWYDIYTWCRGFLANVRSFSLDNPLVTVVIPNFVREFRRFVPNPTRYRTSTGYASLVDPAHEYPRVSVSYYPMYVPMYENMRWVQRRVRGRRLAVQSSHSLGQQGSSHDTRNILALLNSPSPVARRRLEAMLNEPEDGPQNVDVDTDETKDGSEGVVDFDDDDDDDY